MQRSDSILSIVFQHFWPINSSMFEVDFCLNIKYTCHPLLTHFLNIIFNLGIRTDENSSFLNLIEIKSSDEISISFVDSSINYKNPILIRPIGILSLSEEAVIAPWILNITIPWRFSFPDYIIFLYILNRVLVSDSAWKILLFTSYVVLPWPYFNPS